MNNTEKPIDGNGRLHRVIEREGKIYLDDVLVDGTPVGWPRLMHNGSGIYDLAHSLRPAEANAFDFSNDTKQYSLWSVFLATSGNLYLPPDHVLVKYYIIETTTR